MDNAQLIREFFAAFARRDADDMIRHYHPELVFEDPVFGRLSREQASLMWHMLCARATDLVIELRSHDADETKGHAEWDAKYTFSKTGRFVHNRVRTELDFRDGQIVQQKDDFDFWRWATMALGPRGRLLGWSSVVKNAVRKEVTRSLAHYAAAAK